MKLCCFWLAFSFLWEELVYSYPLSKGVAWDLQEVNYRVWRWGGCPVCWNLTVHRSHWIADLCEMNCPALNFFLSVHHELEYQGFLWGFSSLYHTRKDDSISVLQRGGPRSERRALKRHRNTINSMAQTRVDSKIFQHMHHIEMSSFCSLHCMVWIINAMCRSLSTYILLFAMGLEAPTLLSLDVKNENVQISFSSCYDSMNALGHK